MSTRTDSTSSVLIALIVIITFPLWIGLGAGLFGIVLGLMGAAVGVMGALFGAMITLITLPFKILFGWGGHHWSFFPSFHCNGFTIAVVVIIIALIVSRRRN